MQWTRFNFVTGLFFLLWLNSCFCKAPKCNNCCKRYTKINEPRRSVNSTWKRGQIPLCDRFIRFGWYRFMSFNGTQMPNKEVTVYHCGTHKPIWLHGSHPTESGGNVVRKACISSYGNTCRYSFKINVTRCPGNFFVYYLRPVFFCATAYCAGKETNAYVQYESPRLR